MAAVTAVTVLQGSSTIRQIAGGVPTVTTNDNPSRMTVGCTGTAADTYTPATSGAPEVADAWFVTTATGVKTVVTESAGVFTLGTGPSAAAGYLVVEYLGR